MRVNVRYLSAQVIAAVLQGKSLSEVLPPALSKVSYSPDRAFLQALCFGVCRFDTRLHFYLQHLLQKSLKEKEYTVKALLLIGLYQLAEAHVPEHAAVAETVTASIKLKKLWAKNLINAVLREFIRRRSHLQALAMNQVDAYYSHPLWWIDKLKSAWPNNWRDILAANNQHPPFSLRVNLRLTNRENYLTQLAAKGWLAENIDGTSQGIILQEAISVIALPGFAQGMVSVQDGAAQLAAELLLLPAGGRILDACAAPGGKLLHLFESKVMVKEVVAIEKDRARMNIIKENVVRLHPTLLTSKHPMQPRLRLIQQDACLVDQWWDKQPFDRILLDVPCSASGVIRRHPDIKRLRQKQDLPKLAENQLALLTSLWSVLANNGRLLYATCSIFPEENEEVIEAFIKNRQDVKIETLLLPFAKACRHGIQILPGDNHMDGFYYCRLLKV